MWPTPGCSSASRGRAFSSMPRRGTGSHRTRRARPTNGRVSKRRSHPTMLSTPSWSRTGTRTTSVLRQLAAHLGRNPRAVFISSPEVVTRLRAARPDLPADRVRAVLPAPGQSEEVTVGGVTVRVLRIRHNPTRRLPEQHVGFLIGTRATVLHVGDADPAPDNFTLLRALPQVDTALLPFWYVLDEANRRFVATSIAPRRIVGMHLPRADAAEVARKLRAAGVEVDLPPEPGAPVLRSR